MVTWVTRSDQSPITPDYTVAKERASIGMRVTATILFAAGLSVFADVVCSPSRFQSCSVYPVETLTPPRNGGEGNRTPVQNVDHTTYMSFTESYIRTR